MILKSGISLSTTDNWETVETLANGAMSGAMLETYIVSEIIKSYRHNGQALSLYFYRDRDNKEIDLIIDRNGLLYPIEIKRSTSPKIDDVKHFNVLSSLGKPVGKGAIICLYEKFLPLNLQVNIVPVSYLNG